MQKEFLPDSVTEKERYTAHQNNPQNAGYVGFLMQAITPALPYLNKNMHGLDYGCGPTPTLNGLLKTQGLQCKDYDPYFFPELPGGNFNFIFCTEVAEHFFEPAQEYSRLRDLLLPGGILTIMTELWTSIEGFAEWYYAKDLTHVCFYHANTIAYICDHYGFRKLNPDSPRIAILQKI